MYDKNHLRNYLPWMDACKYPVKLTRFGSAICGESKKRIPRRDVVQMLDLVWISPYWEYGLGICLDLTGAGYFALEKLKEARERNMQRSTDISG